MGAIGLKGMKSERKKHKFSFSVMEKNRIFPFLYRKKTRYFLSGIFFTKDGKKHEISLFPQGRKKHYININIFFFPTVTGVSSRATAYARRLLPLPVTNKEFP